MGILKRYQELISIRGHKSRGNSGDGVAQILEKKGGPLAAGVGGLDRMQVHRPAPRRLGRSKQEAGAAKSAARVAEPATMAP